MAILAVLILILYYYFCVLFETPIAKPDPFPKDVIHLDNRLANGTQLKPHEFYDYDSGSVKGPYEYSVQFDDATHELSFTAPDNRFQTQVWTFPLLTHYHWRDDKIIEKDSCFDRPDPSNVKAEGKILFDYIQNNHLITDQAVGGAALAKVFHSDRLFYFKCSRGRIESLHSCPVGTLLNDRVQCEKLHNCTGQPDHYTYPDPTSKFKYFRCLHQKIVHETCPPGQLFEFDACVVPKNACEVRADGFLQDLDRTSFLKCRNGQTVTHHCPPYTYALEGRCENEACEQKPDDALVPIPYDNGTFEYAWQYGRCAGGRLTQILDCPTLWNHWETDVDLRHLPQVFDPNRNACTKPVLCDTVKITDPQVIVPQYAYAKYLKNWGLAPVFDLLTGYRCDAGSGKRIAVDVDPGELILNFNRIKIPPATALKVPVKDAARYFDVPGDRLQQCPPRTFFDGHDCRPRVPDSFTYRNRDVFKFGGLHVNGWLDPNVVDYVPKNVSCTGEYVPMAAMQACVHRDCQHLQFLHQLRGPIKLDDEYECYRSGDRIEKHPYRNPYRLKLEFWEQRLSTEDPPANRCTFGTRIQTGNFILDSTVYMTCDARQPFVFCPSRLTETLEPVSDTFACVPSRSVYERVVPARTEILVYKNEMSHIRVPGPATVQIDQVTLRTTQPTTLNEADVTQQFNAPNFFFHFRCDEAATLHYKILPTHPENVYLENGQLRVSPVGVYDILYDRPARYVRDMHYGLESSVPNLTY